MQTKNLSKPKPAPSQLAIDEYHGIKVEDHYRNLENLEDEEVQNWMKAQSDYAGAVLTKIPRRQYLIDQQAEFDKRKSHSITHLKITKDNHHFYLKKMGDENFAKLYYRKDFSGTEELLYDPAAFKPESGFNYVIKSIYPDWNGEKVAICLTKNGEETAEIVIIDRSTKKLLPDLITNSWPEVSWLPDNSGFLYFHFPVIDIRSEEFFKNTKSVYYKLGQNAGQLNEVFSATNNPELNLQPNDMPAAFIPNENSKYMLGVLAGGNKYADTYYAKLTNPAPSKYDWKWLFAKEDKIFSYIIKEDEFIFLSGKHTTNVQICKTPLNNPDFKNPTVLVKEKKEEVIQNMVITIDGLFYVTTKNGVEAKLYHFKDGIETAIELPQKSGSIELESKGAKYSDLWVTISGWLNGSKRYTYQFKNKSFEDTNPVSVNDFPEFEDLIVKEVLVKSHDGVEVPLSIIHKKGMKMNGRNPVLFRGYGAYGISMAPSFSPKNLLFTMEGGILAIAHVRGGGVKGVEWHNAGKKTTKPNTWKDLIACTEYMIEKAYTSNQHTAILSGSAGGILVGRAMTERPDLFAAVIAQVPLMNTMRSEHRPNGANGVREFGTVNKPDEFKALLEMDAYQHIEKGVNYPATLIAAGLNDARVVVWQPAKFAAKLQACQQAAKPILFLVNNATGHGPGESSNKQYEFYANDLAFAFWQTEHPAYQLEE